MSWLPEVVVPSKGNASLKLTHLSWPTREQLLTHCQQLLLPRWQDIWGFRWAVIAGIHTGSSFHEKVYEATFFRLGLGKDLKPLRELLGHGHA